MVPVDTTLDAAIIEDHFDIVRVRREAPELNAKHNHPAFFPSLHEAVRPGLAMRRNRSGERRSKKCLDFARRHSGSDFSCSHLWKRLTFENDWGRHGQPAAGKCQRSGQCDRERKVCPGHHEMRSRHVRRIQRLLFRRRGREVGLPFTAVVTREPPGFSQRG
jgi:hypothetical protein